MLGLKSFRHICISFNSGGRAATLAAALFVASLLPAQTLPNAVPAPTPEVQFFDQNGVPLAGGKLYTYAAGTTTPQATYTDSTAGTSNANPIILDAAGRASIWIGPLAYKFVLYNALGTLQWTQDNVADTALYFVNYVKTAGTATLITYTAPFTGALTRTLTSKLSETLTVTDFTGGDLGAKINAALSWISASGEINIPENAGGTITTQVVITTPNYLRIHCLGQKGGGALITDGIVGNPAEPMFKITGNTANSGDVLIDNCRFQGNNLTGAAGNGHAIAILANPVGNFGPIRLTLRDDSFWGFLGNGKDITNTPIGAAGVYADNGHIIRLENTDFVGNQYGAFGDSVFKFTIAGGDFDGNLKNGVFIRSAPTGYIEPSENIEILSQAIFNGNGSGGATDGGIYATNFYHFDVENDRFKLNNPHDINTGPDECLGVLIRSNHFYSSLVPNGTNPSVLIGASARNPTVSNNTIFFDFTSVNAVWLNLVGTSGGFVGSTPTVDGNSGITSAANTTSVAKFIQTSMQGTQLRGNFFGSDAGPAGGLAQIVTTVYYIDAPEAVLSGNTCNAGPNLTITNCIQRTVNASPFTNLSPMYTTQGGGTITNNINETAALAGPRFLAVGGKYAIGASVGPPTLPNGLELQNTFQSPATAGTTPNGTFGMATSSGNNAYWGCYGAGPFACWWQAQNQITNLGTFYPLALNPLGGGVSIGLGNVAPPTGLSLNLALPSRVVAVPAASLPACAAGLEGTWATVTDATSVVFHAALVGGGGNHMAVYCDGTGWTIH